MNSRKDLKHITRLFEDLETNSKYLKTLEGEAEFTFMITGLDSWAAFPINTDLAKKLGKNFLEGEIENAKQALIAFGFDPETTYSSKPTCGENT